MPYIQNQAVVPQPIAKVFQVALALEDYPKILPYISQVEIVARETNKINAVITVGIRPLKISYACEITFVDNKFIEVISHDKLFKHFRTKCVLQSEAAAATLIIYEMSIRFNSRWLELFANALLPRQAKYTLQAFVNYMEKL